jgi:hypothetical protein
MSGQLHFILIFTLTLAAVVQPTVARLFKDEQIKKEYNAPNSIVVQHTSGYVQLENIGKVTTAADLVQIKLHFRPEKAIKTTWQRAKDVQKYLQTLLALTSAPPQEIRETQKLAQRILDQTVSMGLLLHLPTHSWTGYQPATREVLPPVLAWTDSWQSSTQQKKQSLQHPPTEGKKYHHYTLSKQDAASQVKESVSPNRPKRQAFLMAALGVAAVSLLGTIVTTQPTLSSKSTSPAVMDLVSGRLITLEEHARLVDLSLDRAHSALLFAEKMHSLHTRIVEVNQNLQATTMELATIEDAVVTLLDHRLHPAVVTPAQAMALVKETAQKAQARGYISLAETVTDIYQSNVDFLIMQNGEWQLFLQLPVFRQNSVHELYRFQQAIFTHNDSMWAGKHLFSVIPPNLLIAQSQDNLYFRVFKDMHALSKCQNFNGLRVCFNDDFARSHFNNSCIKSLLKNEQEQVARHCDTHLLRNDPNLFRLTPNSALFFEPVQTVLNLECWEDGKPVLRKSRKIKGLTRVDLPNFCRAFTFRNSYSSQKPILVEETLTLHTMSFEALRWPGMPQELTAALEKLHNSTGRSVSLTKIMTENRAKFEAEQHKTTGTLGLSAGFGTAALVLCAAIIILLYILYKKNMGYHSNVWFKAT